jgi:hypothetical protein
VLKRETNHWLVAITGPGFDGMIFQAAETAASPRNPLFAYKDLCGHGCAHKRLGAYLDELRAIFTTTESETS